MNDTKIANLIADWHEEEFGAVYERAYTVDRALDLWAAIKAKIDDSTDYGR